MVPEDKIIISIQGLNRKQKVMLKIMWNIDNKEQLDFWLNSLKENDRKEAVSLLILLKYEIMEELLDDEYIEANEVLSKFTLSG